ncbi:hypothetical protein V6B33_06030 [Mangrovibacillus sp. Mu-81]|uniref:hypothetical protein n=1 Tax=Mangrovibacillus sp. Mu-81 TaxID=3121478 RepID=UPI002FE4AEEF
MSEVSNILQQLAEQYLTILVFLSLIPSIYAIIFTTKEKDERGQKITSTSYQYTYFFALAGVLILFIFNRIAELNFEEFRSGIITIFLLANFFLGSFLFILNKRI